MHHCAGLSIRLYHPNAAPTGLSGPGRQMRVCTASLLWDFSLVVRTYGMQCSNPSREAIVPKVQELIHVSSGNVGYCARGVRAVWCMQSYVAEDGCLHIVADKHRIQDAVASLDLGRAQLLTRLSLFWIQRVRCDPGPSHRDHNAQCPMCQELCPFVDSQTHDRSICLAVPLPVGPVYIDTTLKCCCERC